MTLRIHDEFSGANGTDNESRTPDTVTYEYGNTWDDILPHQVETDGSGALKFAGSGKWTIFNLRSYIQYCEWQVNSGGGANRYSIYVGCNQNVTETYEFNIRPDVSGAELGAFVTTLGGGRVQYGGWTAFSMDLSSDYIIRVALTKTHLKLWIDGDLKINVAHNNDINDKDNTRIGFEHQAYADGNLRVKYCKAWVSDPWQSVDTSDFSMSATSLEENGTLTITSTSTDFGSTGPDLVYRLTMRGDTTLTSATIEEGRGEITSGQLVVSNQSSLPYGKGAEIGSNLNDDNYNDTATNRVRCSDTQSEEEDYTFYYLLWPTANQTNAETGISKAETLGGGCTWQTKLIWDFDTATGSLGDDNTDLIGPWPIFNTGTGAWIEGDTVSSNEPISVEQQTFTRQPGNTAKWRDGVICRELYIDQGTTAGSASGTEIESRFFEVGIGLFVNYEAQDAYVLSDTVGIGVDRFTMPGFVRGFHRPDDQHFFIADVYKARGPQARARVMITNNAIYGQSDKLAIATVTSWSNNSIQVSIREGIFYDTGVGIENQHVHVFDASGNHYYVGTLSSSDSPPIASLPARSTASTRTAATSRGIRL